MPVPVFLVLSDSGGTFSLSMNQLVEKISNFSLARSYCEHVGNFITSISSKYGVDAMTATFYGIIGCVSIGIIYFSKRRPRPTSIKPSSYDQCLRAIHGGDRVLHRLEQINEAKANPGVLANTENLLKALLEEEHLDFKKLQQTVAKLEMSGSQDSAVRMLEKAFDKARDDKPHEAYEIEMLLVEMHIFKGDCNEKFLDRDCLKQESISDERRPLYKAIIQKMRQDTKKAKEYWKEFVKVRDPCLYGAPHEADFKEFGKLVDKLHHATQQFPGK